MDVTAGSGAVQCAVIRSLVSTHVCQQLSGDTLVLATLGLGLSNCTGESWLRKVTKDTLHPGTAREDVTVGNTAK